MYIDKENLFSNEQNLASGVSTNVIDLNAVGDAYEELWVMATFSKVIGASEVVAIDVETSDTESFASVKSLITIKSSPGVKSVKARLPQGKNRFLRLKYAVTGASGKVSAFLTPDVSI